MKFEERKDEHRRKMVRQKNLTEYTGRGDDDPVYNLDADPGLGLYRRGVPSSHFSFPGGRPQAASRVRAGLLLSAPCRPITDISAGANVGRKSRHEDVRFRRPRWPPHGGGSHLLARGSSSARSGDPVPGRLLLIRASLTCQQ